MPLAKSTPQPITETIVQPTSSFSQSSGTMEYEGVPVDFFRYFGIEMGIAPQKDIKELKDIFDWAKTKCDDPTIGNILQKISTLEHHLGAPAINEKRFSKMWMYAKMSKQIDEIDKRRQSLEKRRWL